MTPESGHTAQGGPIPSGAAPGGTGHGAAGPGGPEPGGIFGFGTQGTGVLLALLAPVLWSTSGMFVKLLSMEALPLTAWRALFAGLVLLPFIRPGRIRPSWALLVVLAAYTQSVVCFVSAAKLTTIVNAIALTSTAPAWVMVLGWLAARRVIWTQLWPVATILVGVLVMLSEPSSGASMRGNWLALASGIGFGVFTVFLPRVDRGSPGLIGLANLVAAGVIFAAVPSVIHVAEVSGEEWAALVFLGAVQIALATACFGAALRRIPAMQASLLALLEPLLQPIWTYLAMGEVPSWYGVAGGAGILSGILLDFWMRRLSVRPSAA